MTTMFDVWVPGWREFDPVLYSPTVDRMVVLAQLRQHEHRTRYVSVERDGRRAGHLSFRAGQIVTLADLPDVP